MAVAGWGRPRARSQAPERLRERSVSGEMSLRRFTSVKNLRELGRPLFKRFLGQFKDALRQKRVELPADSLEDDAYLAGLPRLFLSPSGLPDELIEALHQISEMANDAGHARLLKG